MVNAPPANSAGPLPSSQLARTSTSESLPRFNGSQLVPSHFATRRPNLPPAWSAGPLPSSCRTSALTVLFNPEASDDQVEPSQRAMRLAATPPAFVKTPPAKSAGPLPSSCTTRACTVQKAPLPVTPPASGDQLDPSQRAIPFTVVPPTSTKSPPA